MTTYLLTMTMECGESHHAIVTQRADSLSLSYFDISLAVDEFWSPGDGDTLTIRKIDHKDADTNLAIPAHVFTNHYAAERFLDVWAKGRDLHHIITVKEGGCEIRHKETMWPVQRQHYEQVAQLAMPFEGDAGAFHKRIEECS